MTERPVVLAVDVGGTEIKAAACQPDGTALLRLRQPTPAADGVAAVVRAIGDVIQRLRQDLPDAHTAVAVGLLLPGVVDAAAGVARYSTNLGWRDLPIRDQIAERVDLPVAIEHDVRAGGLAELRLGAARGVDEALFLSIGTGIAAAVITGGVVRTGTANLAGEIGHVPVMPGGEQCACGQLGCTETYASAAALPRRYRQHGGGPLTRAEQVIAAAGAGDPVAVRVFGEAVTALARSLVGYILLLDPALIVIGGGLSLAGSRLLDPVAAEIAQGLRWRPPVPLVAAHFGADAGQVGAALIGWRAVRADRPLPSDSEPGSSPDTADTVP